MRPADLPDTQRKNFARLLEEEMRNEQEEDGVSHDKAFLRVALNTLASGLIRTAATILMGHLTMA